MKVNIVIVLGYFIFGMWYVVYCLFFFKLFMELCKEYIVFVFGLFIWEVVVRIYTKEEIFVVMVEFFETFFLLVFWFSLKVRVVEWSFRFEYFFCEWWFFFVLKNFLGGIIGKLMNFKCVFRVIVLYCFGKICKSKLF